MRLPQAELAIIADEKLGGYLLSPSHAIGKEKAHWLAAVGFTPHHVAELRAELLRLAREGEARPAGVTSHGAKYAITAAIRAPGGTRVEVRTIWIIDTGAVAPRFVTCYPA